MVLQEELQLALFKTPSGENLFLDRVSLCYAFLFVFIYKTRPNYAIHIPFRFSPDYPQNIYIACCQYR